MATGVAASTERVKKGLSEKFPMTAATMSR